MRIVSCFETADPLLNWNRRMRLDAVLLLLFFVVMCDRLTQTPLHEALGTASLLIVCTHLLVNRTWLRQHFGAWFGTAVRHPRRPSVKNRISTISNVVLLATFAASFISGVMCSQTLFASVTPQVWRMDLSYRTIHVSLSMWFFLAAAVHVGLHARLVEAGIRTALDLQAFQKVNISITTFVTTKNSVACENFHHCIFFRRYSLRKSCTLNYMLYPR